MIGRINNLCEFGGFRLDTERRILLRAEQIVPLAPKAIEMLIVLVENAGKLVEKQQLLHAVWPDTFVEEGNLSHYVFVLRKVLGEANGGQKFIETLPKRGYRFVGEIKSVEGYLDEPGEPEAKGILWEQGIASQEAIGSNGAGGLLVPARTGVQEPAVESSQVPASRQGWLRPRRTVWLRGLFALALMAGLGLYLVDSQQEAGFDVYKALTFLTPYLVMKGQRVLSPDGKKVAFAWEGSERNNWDIYVKLIGTEPPMRLTTSPAQDTSPCWSPDGRLIAFRRDTGPESGFYIVPALGGPERKVTSAFPVPFHHRRRNVDWTPDGKSLVVTDRNNAEEPFALFLVDLETGDRKRLTSPQPASP